MLLSEVRRRGRVSLGGFYARRARRILPAALVTLGAVVGAAFLLFNTVRADQTLWDAVSAALEAEGWRVRRNSPFSGAYICSAYGRPGQNIHVVQVEIDRSLYMDERTVRPNSRFRSFKKLLDGVVGEIAAIGRPVEQPLAAE